jgi:hypothetical protein
LSPHFTLHLCPALLQEEFKSLAKWWKEALGSSVEGVKVSKRLATTPCVVVSSKVHLGGCVGWVDRKGCMLGWRVAASLRGFWQLACRAAAAPACCVPPPSLLHHIYRPPQHP